VHGDPIQGIDPTGLLATLGGAQVTVTVGTSLGLSLGFSLLATIKATEAVTSILSSIELRRVASEIGVEVGTSTDVEKIEEDKSKYYFVHGSSTGAWSGPLTIFRNQIDLDFGSGLYSFSLSVEGPKDNPITGIGQAIRWSSRIQEKHGGDSFLLFFAIPKTVWSDPSYKKQDFGSRTRPHQDFSAHVNRNRASKTPVRYGVDVVFGPTAKYNSRINSWVPNDKLPRQYKFESLRGIEPLLVVPAGFRNPKLS
jgi:hypothetical protein